MRNTCFFFAFFMLSVPLYAEDDNLKNNTDKEYTFIIQDTPAAWFTMRQSNENCLNAYRLGVNELNRNLPSKGSWIIQALFNSLFFMPLTHEEGHRSILTSEEIGSISKPYFNKHGAAYVTGVTDETLMALRANSLPVFTRMYTAGLESDYALLVREKSLLSWKDEGYDVLWIEYFFRKWSVVSYYAMGLVKYKLSIKEEANELKRDIAGYDVYGAIRSLHHPEMEFKRYVDYKDLLPDERKFVKRAGWRSFINLLDPSLILKEWYIKDKYYLNFGLGYTMSPFGDLIDEHFWLRTRDLKAHLYLRQYQNKTNWFPAAGFDFADVSLFNNCYSTLALHGWSQPKHLSFTHTDGQLGGAVDVMFKYRLPVKIDNSRFTSMSVDIGVIAKTQGFLPEEVMMNRHVGFRLGTSIRLK